MARLLCERLSADCGPSETQAFVLEHFASDTVADFERAVELVGEIEDLEDIDRFVEKRGVR
ncbi:hypothetical protein [Mesorhizobium sp. WSM3626]|uniref:hypothetical protein n=1 Tax=Mesorhizobium sp. WSM3626 TaxID=1040987 RepID=UPI0012EB53E6|nr:hypothetical protein [Mesorhizobium sp. WSM3626]